MSISFSTLCCGIVILLLLQHTKSFSLRRIFGPSSTQHLADLLELYDILEDPTFLESSEEWNTAFRGIFESVKATSEGAVEGKGLIATRDFSEGEVVSLYPIHALGYSNGRSPPRVHSRSERVYGSLVTGGHQIGREHERIIGTSDQVYFESESSVFGEDQDDFSYAMTDPSDRYHFDANPKRERGDGLFLAHYINDASFADFSSIVDDTKELMREQRRCSQSKQRTNFEQKAQELEAAAARLALSYLSSSTGLREDKFEPEEPPATRGFNSVMCGFGPPPVTAYVTTRPVKRGEEFLAFYGLGYWLGKAFPEDSDATFDAALAALGAHPDVHIAQERADKIVEAALDAGDRALKASYSSQTSLLRDTLRGFQRRRRRKHRKGRSQRIIRYLRFWKRMP